jgi:hypothetical protein
MVSVGARLGGKYRLERLLGEGGMGAVYAAENENTGRRVAVKVLHGEWMRRPEVAQRFVREARATTAIAHPNIVEVLDLDTDAALGITYIVQELLEGQTLEAHLAAQPERRLSPADALHVLTPVMGALVAAHARGIVHRDLKPANIFLARSRSGETVPKVIDFGIAKDVASAAGEGNHTREGTAIGTPAYMSPEQVSGRTDLNAQTDVWSLGVLLYEMLSGRLPYEAPHQNVVMAKILYEAPTPLAAHCPALSPQVLAIVGSALQRERSDRFGSVRAMLSALLDCDAAPRVEGGSLRASMAPAAVPEPAPAPSSPATQPMAGLVPVSPATQPMAGLAPLSPATQPMAGLAPLSAVAPRSPVAPPSPATQPMLVAPVSLAPPIAAVSLAPPIAAAPLAPQIAAAPRVPDTMHAVERTAPPEPPPRRALWPYALGAVGLTVAIVALVASLASAPDAEPPRAAVPTPMGAPTPAVAPAPVVVPRPVAEQAPAAVPTPVVAAAPVPVVATAPVAVPAPAAPAPTAAPAPRTRPSARTRSTPRSRDGLHAPAFPMPQAAPSHAPSLNADEI